MQIDLTEEIKDLKFKDLLAPLLIDRNTGKNILLNGKRMTRRDAERVKPFFLREKERVKDRTRKFGEVVTPRKITEQMCKGVEFRVREDGDRDFLKTVVLEITCGEAPFLVNRYDVETGEVIPVWQRRGLLDGKLKEAYRRAWTAEEFIRLAVTAYKSTYAYELQGDNLLLARVNLFKTFIEYLKYYFDEALGRSQLKRLADIIAWNVFQMNGLTGESPATGERCKIYDWEAEKVIDFPG